MGVGDKCCCVFKLRNGCIIIGYLSLVFFSLILVKYVMALREIAITGKFEISELVVNIGAVSISAINIILCFVLFVGIHGNKLRLVNAYLIYSTLFFILETIEGLLMIREQFTDDGTWIAMFVTVATFVCLKSYFLLVILTQSSIMKKLNTHYVNSNLDDVNSPDVNSPDENSPDVNSPAEESPAQNSSAEKSPVENSPAADSSAPNSNLVNSPVLYNPSTNNHPGHGHVMYNPATINHPGHGPVMYNPATISHIVNSPAIQYSATNTHPGHVPVMYNPASNSISMYPAVNSNAVNTMHPTLVVLPNTIPQ